jgi:hypothetical protein
VEDSPLEILGTVNAVRFCCKAMFKEERDDVTIGKAKQADIR